MKWQLGSIANTYSGKDGVVRVVDVKSSSEVVKRPIHRLASLLEDNREDNASAEPPLQENLSHDPGPSPTKNSC